MKQLITVSQEDIEKGELHHCYRCPIALAIQRVFPLVSIEVQPTYCDINSKRYYLPHKAHVFVIAFDCGNRKLLKPFSFELEIQ